MANQTTTHPSVANILLEQMLHDQKMQYTLRSQEKGYIELFLRKGKIQKLKYCEIQLSQSTSFVDNDDEFEDWDGIEVPSLVYKMFCHLIHDALESIAASSLIHGSLKINFWFIEKEDGEWEAQFDLIKEKEHHFSEDGKIKR